MTIMSQVRSMFKGANLPQEFWGEGVSMVVYLLNKAPTRSLENSTLYMMQTKGLHFPIVTYKAQKVTGPTYEAQLELIGPGENLEELSLSVEDHIETHKSVCQILQILESPECLFSGLEASFCCVKPIPWHKHGVIVIVSRL